MSSSYTTASEAPSAIRVLVRVRPLNERESKSKNVLQLQSGETTAIDFGIKSQSLGANGEESTSSCSAEGTVSIADQQGSSFTYDAVFGPNSKQSDIFESVTELVDAVVSGYNGTIVAYGQTSSGKTHTIFGEESASSNSDEESEGMVQRSLKAIFEKMKLASSSQQQQHSAKASFFEIYNEKVYDLLSSNDNMLQEPLAVREDSSARGVYVEGLMEHEVNNTVDAMDVLRVGNDNRRVASTSMNRVSSRSHAVFVLTVKNIITDEVDGTSKVLESKFTLVDLAGSERQKTTDAAGERLKEASMINNSLLCLGQVINALVDREQGKERHVPFRDSKLTFLLKDSWGGNSKTCLVATVTPSASSISETISTLKFAQRAKLIKNTAVKNETYSVEALQLEIARLKSELEQRNNNSISRVESLSSMNDSNEAVGGVVITSLQNHNSTLNGKLKILKDRSNLMEQQVNSLKRKLQQETMIRKCKERRITFLSGKLKDDVVGKEVIENLQNELNILREQLDSKQTPESIHWMMKYKEEKIKLDQILTSNPTALQDVLKREALDEQVVALIQAKKSLEKQLASIQQCQRSEVDVMSNDVAKLEKQILTLKSLLSKKEAEVSHYEAEIIATQSQISSLDKDRIEALEFLETVNSELVTEQKKVVELQSSVDSMSQMIEDKENYTKDTEQKQAAQQTELDNVKAQLQSLQTDLDAAKEENCSLIKNLNAASNDLTTKEEELARLKSESELALATFNVKQKEGAAMLDSLKAKLEEKGEQMESLLREKTELEESLKDVSSQNEALMAESELFKKKETEWQDKVDLLEDKITRASMEKDQLNEKLTAAEEDLKRAIAFHEESAIESAEAHKSALAQRDEAFGLLQTEKEALQAKLDTADKGFQEQLEVLQNKITLTEEERDNVRLKEQNLLSTLDALTDGYDQLRVEKDTIEKELKETKKLLKKSTSMVSELEKTNELKVNEMEATAKEETDSLKKKHQQLLSDLEVANATSSQLRLKNEEILKELDETKSLLQDRVNACCSKAVELDTMRDALLAAKEKEEQLTSELNTLNSSSSQLELEKEAAEKDLIETRARLENVEELERISEAKADEMEAALNELKIKILRLEKENETAQCYKTQVEELQVENQSHRESIVTLQSSLSQCEAAKIELDQNAESKVSELQAALASNNEAHAVELSDLERTVESLKTELVGKDESAAATVKETEALMEAIKKQHAEEIEHLKNQAESLKTSASNEEEMHSIKLKEMEGLVASSKIEHTEEVERMNICIESLKIEVAEFESSNARALAEKDVLIEVMKQHHAAEVEEMHKKSEAMKTFADSRVEDISKKLIESESEMASMKNQHSAEIERMRQNEVNMIEKETAMSSKLKDMETASDGLKAEYADEIERLKHKVEELKTDAKNKEQISATKLSDMEAAASRLHIDHAAEVDRMMQQAAAVKSEMLEKDQINAVKVKEMEEMILILKAQHAEEIEKLKLEVESLKAEASTNTAPTNENLEEGETEDSAKETTFDDEDDEFDEAMFLPNVEIQPEANDVGAIPPASPETIEPANATPAITKRVDENSPLSPSMTPFKARREMFANQANKNVVEEKTPLKKPPPRRSKRNASAKATETPVQRVTRRSARLSTSRTPFTDLQDTSISSTSTRKVRTNFKRGAFD